LILTLAFAGLFCEVARFVVDVAFYAKYQLDNVLQTEIKPFQGVPYQPFTLGGQGNVSSGLAGFGDGSFYRDRYRGGAETTDW
jgi:hypothetical protein